MRKRNRGCEASSPLLQRRVRQLSRCGGERGRRGRKPYLMSLNVFFRHWEHSKTFCCSWCHNRSSLHLVKRLFITMDVSHFSAGYSHHIGFEMLLTCSILNFYCLSKTKLRTVFNYLENTEPVCPSVSAKVKTTLLPLFLSRYKFLKNTDSSSGYLFTYRGKENF